MSMSTFEEVFFQVLYVVVALFAHKKLTYEFSVPKYAIFSVGFAILLSIALIRMLKKNHTKFEINFGHILLFGFALTSLISTINVAIDRPFYFFYSIDIALYTLLNAFAAVYISNYFNDKERINRFLLVMIATAGFISIDALYNFYAGKDFFLGGVGRPFDRGSIKATVGNVIFVANYLGMTIPTTIYFLMSYDFGFKSTKEKKISLWRIITWKLITLASLTLMIVTVIVAQTRSEYGGVFLTNILFFSLYFIYVFKKKKDSSKEELEKLDPDLAKKVFKVQKWIGIISIIVVFAFVVLYSIPSPLNGKGRFSIGRRVQAMLSTSSWDERILAWLSSYYQWKDPKFDPDDIKRVEKFIPIGDKGAHALALTMRKLFGRGIGTYQVLTISYMGDIVQKHPRLIWGWNNFKRTHNDYFQVLGETGLVGLFFIIALLFYLIIYLLRTLKKLEDRDDAILLIALAMGFADFAIQSFFSFPGHLLPNTLGAIFLASSALSRQFNKDGWMSYEISLKRGAFASLSAVLIILVFTTTYLRWNYFISEVNFKSGNTKYLTLMKVRDLRSQILNEERKIGNRKDLLKILDGKVKNVSKSLIGSKKTDEIWKESYSLKPSQKFFFVEREIYEESKEYLMRALSMNHDYGKAYFYLAALSAWYHRLGDLKVSLRTDEDFKKFLEQEFDGFQKFIRPEMRRTDLVKVWNNLDEKYKRSLRESLMNYQIILDSISLYKTSLLVFNERNTYKALAQRYAILDRYSKSLIRYISSSKMENKNDLVKYLYDKANDFYNDFARYAKTIIHNIPGAWNRFPDWKNYDIRVAMSGQDIYKTMAKINSTLRIPIDPQYQDLLKWLAEKEVWATEKMRDVGVWGVPDMVFDYVRAVPYAYLTTDDATNAALWMSYALDLYSPQLMKMEKDFPKYSVKKSDVDYAVGRFQETFLKNLKPWIEKRIFDSLKSLKVSARKSAMKNLENTVKNAAYESLTLGREYLSGKIDLKSAEKPILNLSNNISSIEGVFMGFDALGRLSSVMGEIASEFGEILKRIKDSSNEIEKYLRENFSLPVKKMWTSAEENRLMRTFWRDFVILRTAEALRAAYPKANGKDLIIKAKKIVDDLKSKGLEKTIEEMGDKKIVEYANSLLSLDFGFEKSYNYATILREALERRLQEVIYRRIINENYLYPTEPIAKKVLKKIGANLNVSALASSLMDTKLKMYERYARYYGKIKSIVLEAQVMKDYIKGKVSDGILNKLNDSINKALDNLKKFQELEGQSESK